MGSWFSNIHIRKHEQITLDAVVDCLCKQMTARQYQPAASEQDADGAIAILADTDCSWISVYSDLLRHDDPTSCADVVRPISADLHTDVLGIACFDSDYLYLNLINADNNVDAWVGIGRGADVGIKRRSGLTAWKKTLNDYATFSENAKKEYVLADEFLTPAAACLDLPVVQSAASAEVVGDFDLKEKATYLYFKLLDDAPARESVQFGLYDMRYALPCFAEKENKVEALNMGPESRGLSVYFMGPFVENDEITFSDVRLEIWEDQYPVSLTKVQLAGGEWAYAYHAPDFAIPPRIPRRITHEKFMMYLCQRKLTVKFVPHGNPRKMLDITVVLEPDQNPQGQARWNIWHSKGSKKAFIEHHNKIWKMVRAYETDPNNCLPLLKEKDFD